MTDNHDLTFDIDDLGYDLAVCDCGWISPPCPGKDTAAEFWADHLAKRRHRD